MVVHLISDSNDIEVASRSCRGAAKFNALTSRIGNIERTSLTHHVTATGTAHAKTGSGKRILKSLLTMHVRLSDFEAPASKNVYAHY